jgi:hypothetical protein
MQMQMSPLGKRKRHKPECASTTKAPTCNSNGTAKNGSKESVCCPLGNKTQKNSKLKTSRDYSLRSKNLVDDGGCRPIEAKQEHCMAEEQGHKEIHSPSPAIKKTVRKVALLAQKSPPPGNISVVRKTKSRGRKLCAEREALLKVGMAEVERLRTVPRCERSKEDKLRFKTILHAISQQKEGGSLELLIDTLGKSSRRPRKKKIMPQTR